MGYPLSMIVNDIGQWIKDGAIGSGDHKIAQGLGVNFNRSSNEILELDTGIKGNPKSPHVFLATFDEGLEIGL